MKLSFASSAFLVALGALLVALVALKVLDRAMGSKLSRRSPVAYAAAPAVPRNPPSASPLPALAEEKPAIPAATPAPVSAPPLVSDADHAERVRARVEELMNLAMNDDAASLRTIWSELYNPDREIRAGALAAVVQFGDRSVVPNLRALAAQTQDAAEKADILAAADHLALPTLIDLHRAQQANSVPPANVTQEPSQ
jgi:hypothetical protein